MMPNTVLLLELNPMRSNSSKLGANLWVAEAINKSTGTTPESKPLPMKSIQGPMSPIKPEGDLDHHQVGT